MSTSDTKALAPLRAKLLANAAFLVANNATPTDIAACLQISREELQERIDNNDPELAAAYLAGQEQAKAKLVAAVTDIALCEGHKHQLAAAKFLLEASHGFKTPDAPTTAVQINLTMPSPMKMEQFLEIHQIGEGADND